MDKLGSYTRRPNSYLYNGGRSVPSMVGPSTSDGLYLPSFPSYQRFSREGNSFLHPRLDKERLCGGASKPHPIPLPFLADVFGPKGNVRETPHHRSFSYEPTSQKETLQDGGPQEGGQMPFPRPLGSKTRPERCLHAPQAGYINHMPFRFLPGRSHFRLSGPPLWPLNSPLGLFQSLETNKKGSQTLEYSDFVVPRRFPYPSPFLSGGGGAYLPNNRPPSKARVRDKLGEILPVSHKKAGIPGSHYRSRSNDLLPASREDFKDPPILQSHRGLQSEKEGVRKVDRFPKLCSGLPSIGEALVEANSTLVQPELLSFGEREGGLVGRGSKASSSSLVQSRLPELGCSYSSSSSFLGPYDRCFRGGLVGCPSARAGGGILVGSSAGEFDELARAKSHPSLPPSFPPPAQGSLHFPEIRQPNSSLMYKETGLPIFSSSLVPFQRGSSIVPGERDLPLSETSQRSVECFGRQGLQKICDLDRMVPGQQIFPRNLRGMGPSSGRPYGYLGEQQTLTIHIPLSGLQLPGLGYFLLRRLEYLGFNLHIPPLGHPGGSLSEVEIIPGQGFRNSPLVALQAMVPHSRQEVPCQGSPPRGTCSLPGDYKRNSILPQHFRLQALRLDVMRESLLKDGFSPKAVDIILGCHKASTIRQYQSVWDKFLSFLERENVRHNRIKLCHVLNFLSFELETHERAFRTISGYKCALELPLKIALDLEISGDRTRRFLQGCYNHSPPRKRPMPSWDLSNILSYLQTDKFEDIKDISFCLLSQKLLFLLMIATGRRISEIANLSRSIFSEGNRTFIEWLPGFRAKWDSAHSRFVPEPPSILKMDAKSRKNLRLCPHRVLKVYLERRKSVTNHSNNDCLWMLGKESLAASLRLLIKSSRRHFSESVNIIIFPHQTKKLAVSYSWKYFHNAEKYLPARVGNKSSKTLKSSYLGNVSDLRTICVLPLGTVRPQRRSR